MSQKMAKKPVDSRLGERLVSRRTVWRGQAVNFRVDTVKLPDGKRATREYLDHPGAAGVVPFVDKKTIVLVRQCRHPVGEVTLELPAGKLDAGESPLACLRRELREETGYEARRFTPLIRYWPTPAFTNEVLHLYLAEGLRAGRHSPDADEFLEVVHMPFDEALSLVKSGKIKDSKTVVGLLACALRRR